MDLYSAARRLSRPFLFTEDNRGEPLPIAAHGLIGDGFTAALVGADGSIDWLCLPRFDSPSAFAAILDRDQGGVTSISPSRRPFESLQRYDPDTNVLETLFIVPSRGVIRLTDYMPWTGDPRAAIHEVHRRIECVEGEVELEIVFDPRFGYGSEPAEIQLGGHGALALGRRGERLVAVLGDSEPWHRRPRGGVCATLGLRAGERQWMVMSWDAPSPEPVDAYRPFDHLRATRTAWRQWSSTLTYEGPWRHHVLRSALCLKLLIYAPTGAMVAAPTTSMPEWIGGSRNWDYRYAWVRDAAMAIRATNLIGYKQEAREFFHFIRDTITPNERLDIMYAVDGRPVPEEVELPFLSGHRGSLPVRIGNGAKDQIQHDTAGALVDAAHLYEAFDGRLPLRAWRTLGAVIDRTCRSWRTPDHGLWEPRSGMRHNVHSKLMCWLALDRGAGIATAFGNVAARDAWRGTAEEIHEDILRNGLDPSGRHFVSAYGEQNPDAALLLLPVHGFMPDKHPLQVETVRWIRSELGSGPFLHRYRTNDGISGPEGAFVLCGFWLAEALALQGDLAAAQEVFVAHADASNHLGLLAEELDPRTGEQLGNFPQAFSHLGLINAAVRIDLALRLADEGSREAPHVVRSAHRRRLSEV